LEDEDLSLLGKDSLLGQVVVELSLGESLGDTALGVQNFTKHLLFTVLYYSQFMRTMRSYI